MDPLSPFIIKRTEAIYVVIKEVHRLHIERQVKNIFAIHNSPDTKITLNLLFQSDICMWCKKEG